MDENTKMNYKKLLELKDSIIDMYINQSLSSTYIANKIGCTKGQIIYFLKKQNILKNISESKRKYTLNEHYFDNIDNQNKAYVLGWLYSDGYNNKIINNITLTLKKNDKYILDAINQELNSNKPLSYISDDKKKDGIREFYSLNLSSKYMCNYLEKLGLTPNKSFTLEFPNYIPDNLMNHFIRGYFDGNGCICITYPKNKSPRASISIISSIPFAKEMIKYLESKNIFLHYNIPCGEPNNGLSRTTKKSEVKKFMEYIYTDANLYLIRKKDKFNKFFNI